MPVMIQQVDNGLYTTNVTCKMSPFTYSLSTLSWRGRKTVKIGIHLTENGSNQRHVIFDGRLRTRRLNAINKKQKLQKESQLSAVSN